MSRSRKADPGAALVAGAASTRSALDNFALVGERFSALGWRPAAEVLTPVRAVPTIFPQYDAITRVAGHPTDRVGLVHGPSNNGKTEFCIGLLLSFLLRGHPAALVDAEQTTPVTWLKQLMGAHHASQGFRALRPKTNSYEEVVGMVERFATTIGDARAKGEVDKDTTALLVVDSLRKLTPEKLLAELLKATGADEKDEKKPAAKKSGPRDRKKPAGVDGAGGRSGQIKAQINAAWMDRLVPLMSHTGCAIVLIAREYEDNDAGFFSMDDYKVGGGKSPYYDSSIVLRIVREGWVRDGDGASAVTYGERVRVEVRKTKVGGKDERVPSAYFHTSNGVLVPVGFDLARDLLEYATDNAIVSTSGSHYTLGRRRLGNGKHATVKRLYDEPHLLRELEEAVRGEIAEGVRREGEAESIASSSGA